MKLSKEFKIGAIMVVAIATAAIGINFLKGGSLFSSTTTYYGVYRQVSGLQVGNPVTINGYKIGSVKDISIYDARRGSLVVTFSVDEGDFDFPSDSQARIESLDLLGSKTIALRLGTSSGMAESGDTLAVGIENDLMGEFNEQIGPLKAKAEALLSTVDSVMTVAEALLREDARPNLAKSFESIRRTLASLENTGENLDGLLIKEKGRLGNIFANLESITANFAQSNDELGNILTNFSALSDTLVDADIGNVIQEAADAVDGVAQIMEQVNSGQGSLGLLLYNDSLYNNLSMASDNLDLLLEDVRSNPKKYVNISVFGKKDKTPVMSRKEKEELKLEIMEELREGQ